MQNEKIYKTVASVGVWDLVLGIVTAITGALIGAALIVNAARLLKRKTEIMF